MNQAARGIDIGPMEYAVGPVGATTVTDTISVVITVLVVGLTLAIRPD